MAQRGRGARARTERVPTVVVDDVHVIYRVHGRRRRGDRPRSRRCAGW